jgi:teichuronic acid biosynthesis glycosyltransferase TuaG
LSKVTVVIPFFNCKYVDQAIESVLNQTYQNIEIIVVDDGSTSHQERIMPYMDRIHYIGKSNGGTASALNCGIQLATGTYVTWLSSDDLFYPAKIERQVAFMEQHHAAISYTDFHNINEYNQVTQHCATIQFMTARSFIEAFTIFCPVNGCTVMMRKDFVRNIGYFDEKLPYTHDYEFWLRTLLCRVDFHYINEPLTAYRRHSTMGTVQNLEAVQTEFEFVRKGYYSQLQSLLNTL